MKLFQKKYEVIVMLLTLLVAWVILRTSLSLYMDGDHYVFSLFNIADFDEYFFYFFEFVSFACLTRPDFIKFKEEDSKGGTSMRFAFFVYSILLLVIIFGYGFNYGLDLLRGLTLLGVLPATFVFNIIAGRYHFSVPAEKIYYLSFLRQYILSLALIGWTIAISEPGLGGWGWLGLIMSFGPAYLIVSILNIYRMRAHYKKIHVSGAVSGS